MSKEINDQNISVDEDREKLLKKYLEKVLPSCIFCGSDETAEVHCGIVRTSINLATRTKKFHLRANGKPAKFY